MSDDEPACAATDTCEEVVQDGLDSSLGRNGTVNVTDVAVSSVPAASGRRVLFFGGGGSSSSSSHLRGGDRRLQAAANETETEIEYVSGPDASSDLTASQQAAGQINALAETGIADLLEELGLPPDSEVIIGTTKYSESEFFFFFPFFGFICFYWRRAVCGDR